MSDVAPIVEEADLILARLAKLDLASVQHVHDVLMDTTAPDEVAKLAHAQARLSRSCRQNLACLSRLKAEREKAAREAEKHERWRNDGRPLGWKTDEEARAAHLDDAMGRIISHAAAGDRERHTALAHRFDRELDDWYEAPDFLELGFTAQLRRGCRVLGIPEDLAARWQTLPEPTFHPDPEVRGHADDDGEEDWAEAATADPDDATAPTPPLADTG